MLVKEGRGLLPLLLLGGQQVLQVVLGPGRVGVQLHSVPVHVLRLLKVALLLQQEAQGVGRDGTGELVKDRTRFSGHHEGAGGWKTYHQELGLYLLVFFAFAPWTAPLLVWRETEWFHTLTTPGHPPFFGFVSAGLLSIKIIIALALVVHKGEWEGGVLHLAGLFLWSIPAVCEASFCTFQRAFCVDQQPL